MTRHFLSLKSQIMLILVFSLVGCTSPNTSVASQPVSVDNPNPEALTSTPVPEIMVGVVNVDILNIREGPGTSYPIVGSLNKDEKFPILGEMTNSTSNKWLLISVTDNSFGWVTGDQSYVTVQKETVDSDTYLTWQRNVEASKSVLITPTASP